MILVIALNHYATTVFLYITLYTFSTMPVTKIKTLEEIEKETDMNPEFEWDPILDIIQEADDKLKLIKTTSNKKEPVKVKKAKSSKTKGSKGQEKGKKGKFTKKKDDQEPVENESTSFKADKTGANLDNVDKERKIDELKSMELGSSTAALSTVKTKNKKTKGKANKGKKSKKAKRKSNKISQRISSALRLDDSKSNDKMLQVTFLLLFFNNIHTSLNVFLE